MRNFKDFKFAYMALWDAVVGFCFSVCFSDLDLLPAF